MNIINFDLPPEAKVIFNSLVENPEPGDLCCDLLCIKLASGLLIDVSWYPEYDESGRYCLAVFGRDWSDKFLEHETSSLSMLKAEIESICAIDAMATRFLSRQV